MAELNSGNAATGDETRVRYLVTIGIPLGGMLDPETREKKGLLRHGRELLSVDTDAYQVLLRGTNAALRAELVEWATAYRHIPQPDAVVQRCLEAGLLRELSFGSGPSSEWRELRLQPAGVGMGADPDDRCEVEVPGRDNAKLNRLAYMIWAASDGRSVQEVVDGLTADIGLNHVLLATIAADPKLRSITDWGSAVKSDPELAQHTLSGLVAVSVLSILSQGAAFLDRTP